jgi:hypothetical protein
MRTKGGRIIWELAIAFSPRLSESAERILECNDDQLSDCPVKGGKIYSEIIRIIYALHYQTFSCAKYVGKIMK